MSRFLAGLVAVLVFIALPAAARQLSPADLERAANFTQRIQSAYQEGMALSFEMDDAEAYIDSFHAGEIEVEEFKAALDPYMEGVRTAIDDFRARYPRAPSPPDIGSKPHEDSLAGFAEMVVALGGMLDRQYAILWRLRETALAGDQGGYDLASADSMGLAAEMIAGENASLRASLVAIKQTHPQHGLTSAIIGGNEAMAVALKVIEAEFRGEDFEAGKFALGVETSLRDAGRAVIDGEKAAQRMLKDLEGKFADTEADRYSARFIGELVKAYERAFAIEREILESQRGLLDYLRAVNADTETSDTALEEMADFQYALEEQIERRAQEQNIRLEMSAEFARKMQTLQN